MESPVSRDPAVEERVDELLGRMSLEEKVGQTIQAEIGFVTPEEVKRFHLGSVLNGGGSHPGKDKYATAADWVALADAFWDASMDTSDGGVAVPVIWGVDAVHGHNNVVGATLFPHNIGLGATRNPDLLRRIGEITAAEVGATGLDWNFGPTVAVARDDRWGRTYESYSEDPEVVAALARGMVTGIQGDPSEPGFLGPGRLVATVKHFLGDGGTDGGKDQGDNLSSEEELRDIHGAGYFAGLEAGVQTVMASFSSWHGRKMHGYTELLTDVLKGRLGFDGFVVGDWNGHGQVEGCSNESCAAAFNAGVDMFMVPEDWQALYENTLAQVESGEIPMERLEEAVRRILRVKIRAGLFEEGRPSRRSGAGEQSLLGSPAHREVARQAVRESLVLLKNSGGLLPLSPKSEVLVAGDGADDIGKQTGGWTLTWQGTGNKKEDFPGATSIWDGIRETVEQAGGRATLSVDGAFDSRPDVAIVVFGEDPYAEFEGDRESLVYSAEKPGDLELLHRLRDQGLPVVAVFLSGRPMWVNPELNASDAFVAAWLPGSEGGGVADVLFRAADGAVRHDFTGRLSFSWPRTADQLVLNAGDRDYDPLFELGFGLSVGEEGELRELSEELPETVLGSIPKSFFDDGPVDPWRLYVETAEGEGTPVPGGNGTGGPVGALVVELADRERQGDARAVRWSGEETASLLLQGETSVDLTRESNGEMALSFGLYVDQPPSSTVELAMGCGEACEGRLEIEGVLRELPAGAWHDLRFRLQCFAEAGADMSRIDVPFSLSTAGSLGLRFADVQLVSAAAGPADCP